MSTNCFTFRYTKRNKDMDNRIALTNPDLALLVDTWLSTSQFAPKTRQTYTEQILTFYHFVRDRGLRLSDLNSLHATQFSDFIIGKIHEDAFSQATGALKLAACKSLFSFAASKNLHVNIFSHVRISQEHTRVENLRKKAVSWEQFYALLDYYGEGTDIHLRNQAILYTAAMTGARLNELRTLTLGNVTIEGGFISCKIKGKGDKFYSRHLPPMPVDSKPGQAFLRWYYNRVEEQDYLPEGVDEGKYVFCGIGAKSLYKPLTKETFGRIVTTPLRSLELAGSDVTFHGLRHLHGEIVASTEGLHAAQLNLGHTSMTTTQRYAKEAIQEQKRQTQTRLGSYF